MSHYIVQVITDDKKSIGELLAPYDENLDVDPYRTSKISEKVEEIKARIPEIIKNLENDNKKDKIAEYTKALEMSDENLIKFWYGEEILTDGEYVLSTYNPNSKWDWYCIGGRWDGCLRSKTGQETNELKVKDLDITREINKDKMTEFWNEYVEGGMQDDEKYKDVWYKAEYYKSQYGTLENYLYRESLETPYAVVTPDGVWHAPGEMGWFGCDSSDNESQNKFLEWYVEYINNPKNAEYTITAVDCHI